MKSNRPDYEGLDDNGFPIMRTARCIHELSTPTKRHEALKSATAAIAAKLGMRASKTMPFSLPVYSVFMSRQEAKKHAESALLLTQAGDVSLNLCPEYNG